MFARRLAALFLALFTLHLNLLGADFACARHGAAMANEMSAHESAPAANVAHQHAAAAHTSRNVQTAPAVGSDEPPCEIPVQSNCCRALASCSVFYSAQNELEVASTPQLRDMIALGAMNTPPSETAAPEPPPPKA